MPYMPYCSSIGLGGLSIASHSSQAVSLGCVWLISRLRCLLSLWAWCCIESWEGVLLGFWLSFVEEEFKLLFGYSIAPWFCACMSQGVLVSLRPKGRPCDLSKISIWDSPWWGRRGGGEISSPIYRVWSLYETRKHTCAIFGERTRLYSNVRLRQWS